MQNALWSLSTTTKVPWYESSPIFGHTWAKLYAPYVQRPSATKLCDKNYAMQHCGRWVEGCKSVLFDISQDVIAERSLLGIF